MTSPLTAAMCGAVCAALDQEAELRSKAEDRDMARNAVGVLGGRDDSERRRRQQYAADLEDQMRAKQVRWGVCVCTPMEFVCAAVGSSVTCRARWVYVCA